MSRESKFDPMSRIPVDCRCGAPASRTDEKENPTNPRCFVCRKLAAENPEWTPGQVTAAGIRRWLELALKNARARAQQTPGEPALDGVDGRLEWTIREGYERLAIRGEAVPVLDALPSVHPDLLIADRAEAGGVLGLRLVARGEALDVAA